MNMSLCANTLIHSRNVACIDGHDSGTFFLLDIMCDCREQSWNRNPKLNIAVVDFEIKNRKSKFNLLIYKKSIDKLMKM